MGLYSYNAKDINGKTFSGEREAIGKAELVAELKKEGLFCYRISNETKKTAKKVKRLSVTETAEFCRQLAMMLQSGIPLVKALKIIYGATSRQRVKAGVLSLYEEVNKGMSLSSAMLKMPGVFPQFLIRMTQTGENSGSLDTVMLKMSEHYENEKAVLSKLKTAMIYPSMLLVISVFAVVYIITWVLPQFSTLFDADVLPFSTKVLLRLSEIFRQYYMVIALVCVMFFASAAFALGRQKTKIGVGALVLKLPFIGGLASVIYTSRFSSAFYVLYSGGADMVSCLRISSAALGSPYIKIKLAEASEKMKTGEMLSKSLKQTGVFDGLFISMLITGEEAGSLEQALISGSKYYRQQAETALTRLLALAEPLIIILLAFLIGFIAVSVMLPVFNMYGQIL